MSKRTLTIGSYVILDQQGKKSLAKITATEGHDKGRGVLEKSRVTGEPVFVDFSVSEVIADLGPTPQPGSVMGCKVEIWFNSVVTDLGQVDVYYRPKEPKVLRADLLQIMGDLSRWIKEQGLRRVGPFHIEVRWSKSGKAKGMWYEHERGSDLELVKLTANEPDQLRYVMGHELGHSLWHRKMPVTVKRRWIERFRSSITRTLVAPEQCKRLCAGLAEYSGFPSAYPHEVADPVEAQALALCFDWIEQHHGMRPQDLDAMELTAPGLAAVWPTEIMLSERHELVTEYGKTNAEELWCEALAHYILGRLSGDLAMMVEKSLKRMSE